MHRFSKNDARAQTSQRGATAVEFALVMPILALLVFGIIDYGFWFNESLNVRQGVREAARQAVVKNFDYTGCSGTDVQKLICKTKAEIAPMTGPAYAYVKVPAVGWKRGQELVVCGMVKTDALTGLVPLPADSLVKSATRMSIESDGTIAAGSYGDTAPSGADWSWCV